MKDDPTASQIFVPVDGDYAITVLRRIFGSSVDTLLGSTETANGVAVLTKVIGTFNIAILFFATVVAAYMMYQLVLDTARDGEAGGRETNLAMTALRAAGGAALLLPVSSGFSVVQVVVLQLLLWGSGLGDYVWKETANQMQETAAYTSSIKDSGDSFITAGKLSSVMAARVAGHLCMLHANDISRTLQTGDGAVTPRGPVVMTRTGLLSTYEAGEVWYFSADQRYNSRNEVCGSTKLMFASAPANIDRETMDATQLTFSDALTEMANDTIRQNGKTAVAELDPVAARIAAQIFAGQRQTEDIKREIRTAISNATGNFITGVDATVRGSAGNSGSNIDALKESFLNVATENGWMYAAIWQRGLASYVTKLNGARNQLEFINNVEIDPKAAVSSVFKAITGYSNTEQRLFDKVDNDFSYLKTFDGAFLEAGQPNKSTTTSLERVAANNQEQSWAPIQWLYSQMFSAAKTPDTSNQWNDPLIEIQEQGQRIIVAAGLGMAIAGAADVVTGPVLSAVGGPMVVAIGSSIASATSDIVGYIAYGILILGILLAIVLPFLPFVYFLSGAIGWVIMSIETMVAAPLWILLTFAPHKSGDIIGTNKQGLLLLIGVFFRPVLLIIGLLACFIVMRVGLDFVNVMFSGIYMIMSADSSITNIFLAVGLIGMYVLTLITLVSNSCALITGLGDSVMEFIGVRVGILGQNNIGTATEGALNPAGKSAGAIDGAGGQSGRRLGAMSEQAKGPLRGMVSNAITARKSLTSGGGGKAG